MIANFDVLSDFALDRHGSDGKLIYLILLNYANDLCALAELQIKSMRGK